MGGRVAVLITALAYLWRLIVNLVALAVVVGVLSELQGRFEIIVGSVLGILYATTRTIAFSHALVLRQMAVGIDTELSHIRFLLGDPDLQAHKQRIKDLKEIGDRRINRLYIDGADS
jgi:hypothetical protein